MCTEELEKKYSAERIHEVQERLIPWLRKFQVCLRIVCLSVQSCHSISKQPGTTEVKIRVSTWLELYINHAGLQGISPRDLEQSRVYRDKTSLFFHLFEEWKLGWALPKHDYVAMGVIFFGIPDDSITSVHPKPKCSAPMDIWVLPSCHRIRFYTLGGLVHSTFLRPIFLWHF